MGGLIPLGDASRRTSRFPAITFLIILANVFVFLLELAGGDRFVLRWSAIPARIVFGHHWITLLHFHVSAWQLAAHHRQHDLSLGFWSRD